MKNKDKEIGDILAEAWEKYVWHFDEPPHGTMLQMRALAAFASKKIYELLTAEMKEKLDAVMKTNKRIRVQDAAIRRKNGELWDEIKRLKEGAK